MDEKYKTLKALAEAYDVKYSYMKKRAAGWKRDKEFIKNISDEISFLEQGEQEAMIYDLNTIPDDREEWHKRLWDKLGLAAERALDNPELNFYTEDGKLKSKALSDVAAVVDKVQRGHSDMKEEKTNGQLQSYADLISNYRQQHQNKQEQEESSNTNDSELVSTEEDNKE